ncbi:cytochrome P450 [Nocardia pseudobrasiliensis]|uniref:Cytochrome P450 n=1 Tax=Nocardia pseudobrasiliensis TaxID=45979 RepID=A0A370IBD9_9NOCA|nr:cytochrome P450 [Nocardia pseudobrasiliensis]RDI68046.1 cytochrome P450 [Nocardia pseudobrasiliensis]
MTVIDIRAARGLPPGPAGALRVPRQIQALRGNGPGLFESLRRTYGDTVRLPLGLMTATLVCHPDGIKHVLQDNAANYVRGIGYERFKIFMGNGLLTTDGEVWRARRRVVNPMFHRDAIETMVDTMVSSTARVLDGWQSGGRDGFSGDVVAPMMRITLGALGRTLFGTDLDGDAAWIGPAMNTAIEAIVYRGRIPELFPDWVPFPSNLRTARARSALHAMVGRVIADHRAGAHTGPPDLVDLLLATADDDDVRDELMTILMAGHETAGTGLAWALWELADAPETQERIVDEARRAFGGRDPIAADLRELTYTRMVLDEALRLHPPIWIYPRATVAADEIEGWHVPAGECVFLSPYVTHRHPDLWVAPERFEPERFTETAKRDRPKYAYFPFGGGQRKCVGEMMAVTQMCLTLAMLVSRFTIRRAPGATVSLRTAASLRPARGVDLHITARNR